MEEIQNTVMETPVRHILSLSGGKDSTALAIYMRDRVPNMEYAFCDTNEELEETYEYLDRLEVYLGKPIVRLNPERPFSHYLQVYRGVLPDARTRWCTRMLKIKPFEEYVGNTPVINYIGIRADENRKGYISQKSNITARYPFIEDGIGKEDVLRILNESGLGLPTYYEWRSRSGCYFCFFQRRIEWIGLLERHPEKFKEAMEYEKNDPSGMRKYSWIERETLKDLSQPERIAQIKAENEARLAQAKAPKANRTLINVFETDDDLDIPCMICHL